MNAFRRTLLASSLLLLAACTASKATGMSLGDRLHNPLYAAHYYEDLVAQMVNLQLHNDPMLKNGGIKAAVDRTRMKGVAETQRAALLKQQGMHGAFISDHELTQGTALLLKQELFFGTDFLTVPGANLHVYLTSMIDPRDAAFPDKTATDLAALADVYGAQTFSIAQGVDLSKVRTVVLYDQDLKQIYGFVQLVK
jgi:hypothetical protein